MLSQHNPLIKSVRRAASRGSLTEDGFVIAEGYHLLEEARASNCEIGAIIASESAAPRAGGDAQIVSDKTFDQIASTENSQGVIALVRPRQWSMAELVRKGAPLIVLDAIQDPGNLGAIIRSAEAFAASGVALLAGCANPYNPKALRASAGSTFRVPILTHAGEDILDGRTVLAAWQNATKSIQDVDLNGVAIIIGAEGRGVSQHLLERSTPVRIPTSKVESLNAAVAAGVILYEARRQRGTS